LISLFLILETSGCNTSTEPGTTGRLQVTTVTTGPRPDPNGYILVAPEALRTVPIGTNESVVLSLPTGEHRLFLTGLAYGCSTREASPRTVMISAGQSADVVFDVLCEGALYNRIVYGRTFVDYDPSSLPIELYTMYPDGSRAELLDDLVPTYPRKSLAAVSHDGTALAFVASPRYDQVWDIFVLNTDGVRRLTSDGSSVSPTWSPNGARIAFVSWRDGDDDIYVMNADGSGQQQLTSNQALDITPAWSPDGSRIAFASARGSGGGLDLYVMDVDGTNASCLTCGLQVPAPGQGGFEPAWSPDGTRIAFARLNPGSGIVLINADGSDPTFLTAGSDPDWSPDGTRIAFVRDGDISLINVDGSGLVTLRQSTPGRGGVAPAWTPASR